MLPFRPQALAVYREGLPGGVAPTPLRAARWPLVALVALLAVGAAFVAVVRVPQAVTGSVVGVDGGALVAVFPGSLDPLPAPGAEATLREEPGRPPLRVVRAELVVDAADAGRWGVPPQVARPLTVVLLAGDPQRASGQVSLVVATPTLLELIPGLERTTR